MIRTEKESVIYLWSIVTALVAFCIGYIHHRWFFPLYFHGDAASMHVLAEAILDEGSLLPTDFSYGNQLVFLRSSPFIALTLLVGFTGYKAFILGSSLSIAFWGVVLYLFLSAYFKSRRKGFLFSILLLLPLGPWDFDLILGQQSHLSNAILALGFVVSICLYILDKSKLFLVVACVCLFVMSSEAPIRGLLVLVPLLISIGFTAASLRSFLLMALSMGGAFSLAYVVNKLLIKSHPIAVNYFSILTFKSSNDFLDNFIKTTRETIRSVSSLNTVSGETLSVFGFIVYASGILLIIGYLGFVFAGALNAARLAKRKLANPQHSQKILNEDSPCLVYLTAVVGVIVGAFAVAALNPDSSRHYIWAIFLVKLFIFKWLYDIASRLIDKKRAVICVLAVSLMMSSWLANLVKYNWNTDRAIESRNFPEEIREIKEISEKTGIRNIYGEDFWRMMPLNTLMSNMNAQDLILEGRKIYPHSWLTRPSWSYVEGDVLYYLKDGAVDKVIKEKLINVGGDQVQDGNGYSLWKGPRVWCFPSNTGCYESSLIYKGESLSNLPATVGILQKRTKETDGRAGFLVFGPYSSLKAGEYRLNVYGSSDLVASAYVDVVSGKGTVVHARFDIEKNAKGLLVDNADVHLSDSVSDIEVRVWVGENDSIDLFGYSLKPYLKN